MCGAAISSKELSVGYGKKVVVSSLGFEVRAGEILAVLGPNGAGKTTLLRCMMDMLHWETGRSLLDGEDIRTIQTQTLWRRMAYVPQARSAATSYTAFQTVLLGRSTRIGAFSSPKKEDMDLAERVMKRLGIWELADKPCHAISGGELQMVLIARAINSGSSVRMKHPFIRPAIAKHREAALDAMRKAVEQEINNSGG